MQKLSSIERSRLEHLLLSRQSHVTSQVRIRQTEAGLRQDPNPKLPQIYPCTAQASLPNHQGSQSPALG